MNSMMRKLGKGQLGTLMCSLWLTACSDVPGATATLKVDRSNTLDFSRGHPVPSLEGRWNAVWPKVQIARDATGLYTGRLVEANARCGYERGEEVLRGRVDADGIFSGEALICATGHCPGVSAKWIYFMALVEADANRFVGAVAPTAYEGCNAMFRGLPMSGIRDKSDPMSEGLVDVRREARLARDLEGAALPSAKAEQDCSPVAPRGYLQMAEVAQEAIEVSIDGSDWGIPPFLRPIAAGNHRIVLKRADAPPIARTVCIPGGKEPFLLKVSDFFDQAARPSEKLSMPRGMGAGPRATGKAAGSEEKACKRSSKKGVLKITLPAMAKASVAIDGKVQNTRGRKILTRELTAGEHTVLLLRTGAPDVMKTVCVQEGKTPTHVNFEAL